MISWVPTKKINQDLVNKYLCNCIDTNQFSNYGPNVRLLEKQIRDILQIDSNKCVIATCNGSAALHALASGINWYHQKDMNWATQSFTFPPSAQGILANAKILDINDNGGLDINSVDENIDGIIVTNVFGNVVDIDQYVNWATTNKKILLFDNAATPFTFYKDKNALNYGHGSIISFHHTKPLGFGEGGAIIVNKEYENLIRRVINFGIDHLKKVPSSDLWNQHGSNYKMSDISAVYIIQYLSNYQSIISHHIKLYDYLKSKLDQIADIRMFPNFSSQSPFLSCFCLLSSKFTNDYLNSFQNYGIYCRKYYAPLKETQVAEKLYQNIMCIPCTIDMTEEDLDHIIFLLKQL